MSQILDDRCLRRFSGDDTFELSFREGETTNPADDPRYNSMIAPLLLDPQHAWHVSSVVNVDLPGLRWSDPHCSGRWQRWLLRALPEMHSMARLDVRDGLMGDLWMRALIDALIAQRCDAVGGRHFREQQQRNQRLMQEILEEARASGGGDEAVVRSEVSSLLQPTLVLHFENNLLTQSSAQQIGRFLSAAAQQQQQHGASQQQHHGGGGGFNLELHLRGNAKMGDHSAQVLSAHAAKAFAVRDAMSRVTLRFLDMSRCDVGGRGLGDLLVNCSLFCRSVFTDGVEHSATSLAGLSGAASGGSQQRAGSLANSMNNNNNNSHAAAAKSSSSKALVVPTPAAALGRANVPPSQSIFSRDAMRNLPTGSALRVVDFSDNAKMNSSALSMLVPALLMCCPHLRGIGMGHCAQQGAAVVRALCDALTSLCRSCHRVPALEFLDLSACQLSDAVIFKLLEFLTREGDHLRLSIVDVSRGVVLPDDAPEKAPIVVGARSMRSKSVESAENNNEENAAATVGEEKEKKMNNNNNSNNNHGKRSSTRAGCRVFIRSSVGRETWRALFLAVAGEDDDAVRLIASSAGKRRRKTRKSNTKDGGNDDAAADDQNDDDGGGDVDMMDYLKSVSQSPSRASRAKSVGNTGSRAALDAALRAAARPPVPVVGREGAAAATTAAAGSLLSPTKRSLSSPASAASPRNGGGAGSLMASPINKMNQDQSSFSMQQPQQQPLGASVSSPSPSRPGDMSKKSNQPQQQQQQHQNDGNDVDDHHQKADRALNFTVGGADGDARSDSAFSKAATSVATTAVDATDLASQASSVLQQAAQATLGNRTFTITVAHDASNCVLCTTIPLIAGKAPTAPFFSQMLLADLQEFCNAQQQQDAQPLAVSGVHVFLDGTYVIHVTTSARRHVADQLVRAAFSSPAEDAFPRLLRVLHEVIARQNQLADLVGGDENEDDDDGADDHLLHRRRASPQRHFPATVVVVSINCGGGVVDCPRIERCNRHKFAQPSVDLPPMKQQSRLSKEPASPSSTSSRAGSNRAASDAASDGVSAALEQLSREERGKQGRTKERDEEEEEEEEKTKELVEAAAQAAQLAVRVALENTDEATERKSIVSAEQEEMAALLKRSVEEAATIKIKADAAAASRSVSPPPPPPDSPGGKIAPPRGSPSQPPPPIAMAAAGSDDDDNDDDGEFSLAPPADDEAKKISSASSSASLPPPPVDVFAFESLARTMQQQQQARPLSSSSSGRNKNNSGGSSRSLMFDPFSAPVSAGIPKQNEAVVAVPPITTEATKKRVRAAFDICARSLRSGMIPLMEQERKKRRVCKGWTTELSMEGVDTDDPGESPRLERVEIVINVEFEDFIVVKTCHSAWSGVSRVLHFIHPLIGNGFAGADVPLCRPGDVSEAAALVICFVTPKGSARTLVVHVDHDGFGADWPHEEAANSAKYTPGNNVAAVARAMQRLEHAVSESCNNTKVWKSISAN